MESSGPAWASPSVMGLGSGIGSVTTALGQLYEGRYPGYIWLEFPAQDLSFNMPPEAKTFSELKTMPIRQVSGEMSDDNAAIPSFDPADTAGVLLERLEAWKHACGYLENHIMMTAKIQTAQAKEYERVLKTVANPLREGHHFDQELGGVAGLFGNIRANMQGMANYHLETERNLKSNVLPVLELLHTEIKDKHKELTDGVCKSSKSVDRTRNTTQKHIELLGQGTASHDASGGNVDAINDPCIIQQGVYHRLNKQILEENNNTQALIVVQKSVEVFEAHVIQTFRQALQSFAQFMGGQAVKEKELYDDMSGTAQKITDDFEWNGFVQRNNSKLVDPNTLPRIMSNISFPNQNHPATKPLIEGTLERKGYGIGALRGYSPGYYIVTPCKYLHQFKDEDNFRQDPTLELALYLPDCTVGAVDGRKFNIKGKDVSKSKVGPGLHTSHELTFKAHTASEAEKWWALISDAASRMTGELPARSEPRSPVLSRNVSGT